MAFFSQKRFKKKERSDIQGILMKPQEYLIACEKGDFMECLTSRANMIFGFNGWSHSVSEQTIDFIEQKDEQYDVRASALVKVMLKDGAFHEDIGYGSACHECKGDAIISARKAAASDGLKNALSCFGQAFSTLVDSECLSEAPKKITAGCTLSGVKRKLAPEFDSSLIKKTGNLDTRNGFSANFDPKPGTSQSFNELDSLFPSPKTPATHSTAHDYSRLGVSPPRKSCSDAVSSPPPKKVYICPSFLPKVKTRFSSPAGGSNEQSSNWCMFPSDSSDSPSGIPLVEVEDDDNDDS